jgi:hypothetical protein
MDVSVRLTEYSTKQIYESIKRKDIVVESSLYALFKDPSCLLLDVYRIDTSTLNTEVFAGYVGNREISFKPDWDTSATWNYDEFYVTSPVGVVHNVSLGILCAYDTSVKHIPWEQDISIRAINPAGGEWFESSTFRQGDAMKLYPGQQNLLGYDKTGQIELTIAGSGVGSVYQINASEFAMKLTQKQQEPPPQIVFTFRPTIDTDIIHSGHTHQRPCYGFTESIRWFVDYVNISEYSGEVCFYCYVVLPTGVETFYTATVNVGPYESGTVERLNGTTSVLAAGYLYNAYGWNCTSVINEISVATQTLSNIVFSSSPPPPPVSYSAQDVTQTNFTARWLPTVGTTTVIDVADNLTFDPSIYWKKTSTTTRESSVGFDFPLTPNTTYYYRVWAVAGSVLSCVPSEVVTVTTLPVPAPPAGLAVSNLSQREFTLSWNTVANTTRYVANVAEGISNLNFEPSIYTARTMSASFTATALAPGTVYRCRVRTNETIPSDWSDPVTGIVAITLQDVPEAPQLLDEGWSINNSTSGFTFRWNAVPTATDYVVDVGTSWNWVSHAAGFPKQVGNVTSYTVSDFPTGYTSLNFYYRIYAINSGGIGAWSANGNAQQLALAPRPPSNLHRDSNNSNSVTVHWALSLDALQHVIEVSSDAGFSTIVATKTSAANYEYDTVTGLTSATQYWWRMKALAGDTYAYPISPEPLFFTTSAVPTAPGPPTGLNVSNRTSTSFQMNWTCAPGATWQFIDIAYDERFTLFAFTWKNKWIPDAPLALLSTGALTYGGTSGGQGGLGPVAPGSTLWWRMRAMKSTEIGNLTSVNSEVSSTTLVPNPPTAPISAADSEITSTSFKANWYASSGASNYNIYVSTSPTMVPADVINGLNVGNVIAYRVEGLPLLSVYKNYYYAVTASNEGGTSSTSATQTTRVNPAPLDVAPVANVATSPGTNSFVANWSSVLYAIGYYIDVATDSEFNSMVTGWSNHLTPNGATNITVTGLVPATNYYYRVRAWNDGGLSPNSSPPVLAATSEFVPYINAQYSLMYWYNNGNPETDFQCAVDTNGGPWSVNYIATPDSFLSGTTSGNGNGVITFNSVMPNYSAVQNIGTITISLDNYPAYSQIIHITQYASV